MHVARFLSIPRVPRALKNLKTVLAQAGDVLGTRKRKMPLAEEPPALHEELPAPAVDATEWRGVLQKMAAAPARPAPKAVAKKKPAQKPKPRPAWYREVRAGEFDDYEHGYWRARDGTYTYRHPDGRVLTGCTGCDKTDLE